MPTRAWLWIAIAAAATAAGYVLLVPVQYGWVPATDSYAYFYPKALYAIASLHDGGRGLLWNAYQNCGQPFFGMLQTGLLYPPYWLFLVLDPEPAFRGILFIHLLIAGVGAYALGRELGARPLAAIAGALAFEMGNATVSMTVSMPTHNAPYVLIPIIMLCTERLLRDPTMIRALALALVLAVANLPGMPQTVFFAQLLIAGRIVWELVTRRVARRASLLGLFALALVLSLGLAAVQLFPEIDVVRTSLRRAVLTPREINPYGPFTLEALRKKLSTRSVGQPFLIVPCAISLVALVAGRARRLAWFYAIAAAVSIALAFGPGTPLYDLYARLPLAGSFRLSMRFLWVTSFCLSPLTALGAEALAATAPQMRARAMLPPAIALAVAALWALTPGGFSLVEWSAIAVIAAACAATLARPSLAGWLPAVVLVALVVQLVRAAASPGAYLLPGAPDYSGARDVFLALQRRMLPQDRVYLVHGNDLRFIAKSASLFRLPAVLDYEPLVSQRFAEYSVMMWTGRKMATVNDIQFGGPVLLPRFSRSLLDLTAARYFVVEPKWTADLERIAQPLQRIDTIDGLTIFENPTSRPRAAYVPRVEVVADPDALLARLASGRDDLAQIALLEAEPASGFTGSPDSREPAGVRFERDEPEHLVLQVDAPAAGFLVLSDQYAAGWVATVNGRGVPIERANYAFRAVEVPGGPSRVEFRYAPNSLALGEVVTAVSIVAVGVLFVASRRRGRSTAP